MDQRLDEMQNYIRIAGANLYEDRKEPKKEVITESVKPANMLFEELNDLVFKLRSYSELSEDQKYALGVEEGLSRAADMITSFIDRHNK